MKFIEFTKLNDDRFIVPEIDIAQIVEDTKTKTVTLHIKGYPQSVFIKETYAGALKKLEDIIR